VQTSGGAQLTSAAVSAGDSLRVSITTVDSKGNSEFMCYPGLSNTGALEEDCLPPISYHGSNIIYTDMVDGTNLTYAAAYVLDSTGKQIDLEVEAQ
jgi:hypothetical protein